jgi:hypothetical protein
MENVEALTKSGLETDDESSDLAKMKSQKGDNGRLLSFDDLDEKLKQRVKKDIGPIIAITDALSDGNDQSKMASKKGDAEPVDPTFNRPIEDWPEWAVPPQLKGKWMAKRQSPEQRAVKEMVSGTDLKKMKSQKGDDIPSWVKGKKK